MNGKARKGEKILEIIWKIKGWKGELGHALVRCIEIEVFEVWEEPGYAKYTQKLNRITVR